MSGYLIKVVAKESFHNVFGADSFTENWPEIHTTGVLVNGISQMTHTLYYVCDQDGRPFNDTAFFSQEEMNDHLKIIF
jgi:hypothetical protein